MIKKNIYNLEFKYYCEELNIDGYVFKRVKNYEEQMKSLQHLITTNNSEYSIEANTGTHAITAFVEIPDKEKKAVLPWANNKATALEDILLLLSIFTGRDVFSDDGENGVIVADPREYRWGTLLTTSIPRKWKKNEKILFFGCDKEDKEYYRECNIGFEEGLNNIYSHIKKESWLEKYQGYFLLLLKPAERRQILETAFILHWTILEHLFTLHNKNWLSDKQIEKLSSVEKISFLLVEYALKSEISKSDKTKISELAKSRNRVVHFGKFPDKKAEQDAELIIRLTEFIIAKILDLYPPNHVFNTIDRLEEFFNQPKQQKTQ